MNFHPIFVHFPIALLPSAFLLYALGIFLKKRSWCVAGRACLYLGVVGTAASILTGWDAQEIPHNDRIHILMMAHLKIGLWIGVLSTVLAIWSFLHNDQRPKAAPLFLMTFALLTYLVFQNGDLGSRMVFVEGAAVKPAVSVIQNEQDEFSPDHHHDHHHHEE